jgi:hypothetical protein
MIFLKGRWRKKEKEGGIFGRCFATGRCTRDASGRRPEIKFRKK